MSRVIQQLYEDHANARRLLEILAEQAAARDEAIAPDYLLMLDIMHYMTHYPDLFHHPREDALFKKLVERDPGAESLTADLLEEHATLAEEGARLLETLRNAVSGVELRPGALESRIEDYVALLDGHMEREETGVFPLAEALLTDDEWEAVDEAVELREDPVFGQILKNEYLTLRARITQK